MEIELTSDGQDWVGSIDVLEPGSYQYKLVYTLSLYDSYQGAENVTIEKEGKDPMYLTLQ